MFRNPRENIDRAHADRLAPSVGRPPSPQRELKHMAAAKTTPLATPPAKKPRLTSAAASAGPRNGSILSFFRKADPGSRPAESLFVGGVNGFATPTLEPDFSLPGSQEDGSERGQEDGSSRFNEIGLPNKRRRPSPPAEVVDAAAQHRPDAAGAGQGACSPPPPDDQEDTNEIHEEPGEKPRLPKIGPFVDSDSEEDEPTQPAPIANSLPAISVVSRGEVEDEHAGDVIPQLKHESTSYGDDGFADFDALGEFDDVYEEGDEAIERRWLQEQRRIEMIEQGLDPDGDEDFDLDDYKSADIDDTADTSNSSSCPICSASFAGVSEQEASVHVNNCLDGNPTPLRAATDIKQEPNTDSAPSAQRFRRPARPPQESPFVLGQPDGASAFSRLMSGHAEDAAWATAAADEHASRGKQAYQRTCPFYKILPGFNICVDAFRYGAVQGCEAYFLSHFHSDHYVGLTASWSHGPIYCSRPTGNLVRQQLRVDPKYVVDLEFGDKFEVPGSNGVCVTMIPANHCPGSSLYLFEKVLGVGPRQRTQRVLHCGDFRACPAHVEHPLLKPEVRNAITGATRKQRIDVCYLDTTYLNPKYAFPSQEEVISACSELCIKLDSGTAGALPSTTGTMAKFVRKDSTDAAPEDFKKSKPGSLLVIVGTYSIGKERICLGIAKALNSKVFAPPGKRRICAALEDPELDKRLTKDPREAQVHMAPLFEIRAETLADYLAGYSDRFSAAVAFRPSGWNYRPPGSRSTEGPTVSHVLFSDSWKSTFGLTDLVPQRGSSQRAATYGVPYSEHSSFRELTMFCCALDLGKIIPTVNVGSAAGRARMRAWMDKWAAHRRKAGLYRDLSGWYAGEGTRELRTSL